MIVNTVQNPSAEGATASLISELATTVTIATDAATGPGARAYRLAHTSVGRAGVALRVAERPVAASGDLWWARGRLRLDTTVTGSRTVTARVSFRNSAGAVLGTAAGAAGYPALVTLTLTGQTVVEFVVSATAPANTATADVQIYREAASATTSDVEFVDSLLLAKATTTTQTVPPAFFAGTSSPYSVWSGTANASTSIYYETAPMLTAATDEAPGPRVILNFTDMLPATETATIHRITDASDVIVPGAHRAPARGGLVRTDFYAPVLSPVRYYAEMFNDLGVSIGVTENATTILATDPSYAYVMSPVDPRLQVRIEMDVEAGSVLRDGVSATIHEIGSRRVLISEATYGLTGTPMSFWTATIDEYRRALAVFRSANSLVVFRVPPPMEIPRVFYAFGIPARSETNLPRGVTDFLWDLTVEEVSAPTTQVIVATITYGRFRNAFPTYGAFRQAYATYQAAQLNPPPEA